jgi:hypothetical protein
LIEEACCVEPECRVNFLGAVGEPQNACWWAGFGRDRSGKSQSAAKPLDSEMRDDA